MKVRVGENIHVGDVLSDGEVREHNPGFQLNGTFIARTVSRWLDNPPEATIEPYTIEPEPEAERDSICRPEGTITAQVANWSMAIEPYDPVGVDMENGAVYKINTPQALSWIGYAAGRWSPGDEENRVAVHLTGTRPRDPIEVDSEHQPERPLIGYAHSPRLSPGEEEAFDRGLQEPDPTWNNLSKRVEKEPEPRDEVDLTPEEMDAVAYALCFARAEDMAEKLGISEEEAGELRDRVYNKLID